jgi:hypothetical protein
MRVYWLFAAILAGCSSRSNLEVTTVAQAEPFPDDCKVDRIDGDCDVVPDPTDERRLAVTCKNQPPNNRAVAQIYACWWDPDTVLQERLRQAACRAGGDTLFFETAISDGCKEEDWEGKRSVPRGSYIVYRLKH